MIHEIDLESTSDFIFYAGPDGEMRVEVIVGNETVWLTQKSLAELFDVDRTSIGRHIANIFSDGEVDEVSVSAKTALTASDGKSYETTVYNLDIIISVGYRVNSYNATQFRIWATKILKEYLVKGFAMDDERLKQGKTMFGKDYFDELLQRIREIRASERRLYQKVTDLYALSADYDSKSPITQAFFATVQNKLEYAVTGKTSAEIIRTRADAKTPHMGLTAWSKKEGKIIYKDTTVAKNYMVETEIDELNRLVNMYLDYAENQAKRNILMRMVEWVAKLDSFLKFNDYSVLLNAGTVSKVNAEKHAKKEFEKYRVIQDRNFTSDFDKIASGVITAGKIPKESDIGKQDKIEPLSDFNKKLDQALNYKPKKDDKGRG